MDISTLGLRVDIEQVKRAIDALQTLAKIANNVEKQVKDTGEAAKDSSKAIVDANDKAVASFAKAARAIKLLEDAQLKGAKADLERAKSSRIAQQQLDASLAAKIQRENAYAAAIDRSARLAQESSSRQAATSAREAANLALKQKYLDQGNAAMSKTAAYAANQQSLIENRTLTTQARIEQGAQRLALQQEKFEYQKQRAAERASKGAESSWKGVLATLRDFTVVGYGARELFGVGSQLVKTADNLTLLDSRLKLATKSNEEFKNTQEALYASSIKNGFNVETQVNSYTQLQRSTKAMGLSTEQLTFLTDSFAKAAVVSGASTESYKSALTQLNQGLASGVIRGQEFNSVAEQAPAILDALANGLRGNNKEFDALEKKGYLGVAALRKMANEGKLVNSTTMPALIKGLQETNEQFDKMPPTVGRAIESLSSSFKKWLNDQNTASGATQTLASGLTGLSKNFDDVVQSATVAGTFIVALYGSKMVGSVAAFTAEQVRSTAATINQERAMLAQATAARASALGIEQATIAQRAFASASNAAALSASLLGKAFNFIGGWPTLVAIGVTTVIAYWDELRIAMGNTRVEAEKTGNAVVEAIEKGNRAAANALIQEKKLKAHEAQQRLDLAQKRATMVEQRLGIQAAPTTTFSPLIKTPEALQSQKQEKDRADAIKKLAGRSRDEYTLAQRELQNAKQVVFEANAVVNAAEAAKTKASAAEVEKLTGTKTVSSVITGKSPVPEEKKPKLRSGLTGEQSAMQELKAQETLLKNQIADLKDINVLKSDQNEYDKKSLAYHNKALAVLNDSKVKNKDSLSAQFEALSVQAKQVANLERQKKALEDRNKAQAEWNQMLDAAKNKEERLSLFDPVRVKEQRTEEEKLRDVAEERYNNSLSALSQIEKLVGSEAAKKVGEDPTKIRMDAASAVLSGTGSLSANESTLQAQADYITQLQSLFDEESAMWQKLEEMKTAVTQKGAADREATRKKEVDQQRQNNLEVVNGMQEVVSGITGILEKSGREQSGIMKAMFFANKALAMAEIIIQTQMGAAKATGLGPFGIPMATFIEGMGAARLALVASTSVMEYNQKFAKGAAFSGSVGGGNDVLTTPTTFPMSGGRTGLAGEAGPEGILPLRRDAKGRLGVSMVGGNGGNQTIQQNSIQINITGSNDPQETANAVNTELVKAMKSIAREEIVQAKRQRVIN